MTHRFLVTLGLAVLSAPAVGGAQAIDRTKPPVLAPPPSLQLPDIATATLPNGLTLHVVEMREVPLVQFTLAVAGGGREDHAVPGLASFTADMLDEGADTLDAFGIAALAEYYGANLRTTASWDEIRVSLKVPRRNLDPALALMAAVTLRPTFRSTEVTRQRDLRLARILQERDRPETVASLAFNAIVFPERHPYHASLTGDSLSTVGLDSTVVRNFYHQVFCAGRATLIVTGDMDLAEARAATQRHLGAWQECSPAPLRAVEAKHDLPSPVTLTIDQTRVYLIDKPGAAQSVIRIGGPGISRHHEDYIAIEVMNTILGGSFSSRLNSNLRETKGYTYGARSRFSYRPMPGPFTAGASVRTDVTDSSLVEFFREIRAIRDAPVSPTELERAKAYLALGLAGDFETTSQMAGNVAELLTFGLPLTYYNDYVQRVMAVTGEEVQRVARHHLRPDNVAIVVVGDLARIREDVEALALGPSTVRDLFGQPVAAD
ncbi:MAG: insulinase family protein [Gemmatimonadales bacterium]|nr:insulinase family protein [Gemmatimonadales bacterium]